MFKILKVVGLVFCLFLVACQTSDKTKQSFCINIGEDPQSLDPRKARDVNSYSILNMLFEGLTRLSKEGSPEGALAEKIEISEDQKKYTFTLRKSFWSNGDKVTSYDFAYSWKKILDEKFPSSTAYQLYMIKNAKLAKEGKISVDEVGITTLDENTLVVELERPVSYFLELLSFPFFFPVNSKVDKDQPGWAERKETYVSNGPFKLNAWVNNDKIDVIKNELYWDRSNVKLGKISLFMVPSETEFNMFEVGELDWAGSPFSTLPVDAFKKLKKQENLHIAPYLGTYFLRVNTNFEQQQKSLLSVSFRNALASSIDREGITTHVLQ